jgi:hypothetical protein
MKKIINCMVVVLMLLCQKTEAASAPLSSSFISPLSDSVRKNTHVWDVTMHTYTKTAGFLRKFQYKLALKSFKRLSKSLDEGTKTKKNVLSTISLVLGIIGAVVVFIPGIAGIAFILGAAALITGIIALGKRYNNSKASRAKAITGLVLGGLLLLFGVAALIVIATFFAVGW